MCMKLHHYLVIVLAICLFLGGIFFLKGSLPWQKSGCSKEITETIITLNNDSFTPATTTIKQCTKVTFQIEGGRAHWPASDLHPTHLIYPEFDPQKPINSGNSWSFIFDKVGKWRCHDHLHPQVRCIIEVSN